MTRLIITFVLIAGLIVAATWEQIYITNSYKRLGRDLEQLSIMLYADENVATPENIAKSEAMYKYWTGKERSLAMFARHTDLALISNELIYIRNFIKFNDQKEAAAGLERLRYLVETHHYNVGTSVQNVI